ncbi:MAG: hypothetical protein QG656_626, partial [Candidatus Hydrogenedentes bacterium]|nr:hypothetical protein [Candidatus Hydrogenedentota bacterium]
MNLEPEIILSDKVVATAHEITRRRLSAGGIVWRAALMAILFLTFLPFVFLVVTSFKNT